MTKYLVLLLVAAAFQSGARSLECYSCASSDEICGIDVSSSTPTKLCGSHQFCYSKMKVGGVERGCMPFPRECIADPNCVYCSTSLCNDEAYKALECFECDSNTNVNCVYNLQEDKVAKTRECGAVSKAAVCYTTMDAVGVSGRIVRGCANSESVCTLDRNCVYCNTTFCNTEAYRPLNCYECTSETNNHCGYNFKEDQVGMTLACGAASSVAVCHTTVISGHESSGYRDTIIRGCKHKAEDCPLDFNCVHCNTALCNTKVSGSLECFKCDSKTNDYCGSDFQEDRVPKTLDCGTDSRDAVCYTTMDAGDSGSLKRGCKRTAEECTLDPNCAHCNTSLCNNKAYRPLQCFKCDSKTNANCGYNFQEDKVPMTLDCGLGSSSEAVCYTTIDSVTGRIVRGCSPNGNSCTRSGECVDCNTPRCNGKSEENELQCFNCDTIGNKDCSDHAISNFPRMVVNCSNVFKEPLCYKATLYGHTYRGCTGNKISGVCRNTGMDSCDVCISDKCNSSSQLAPSFVVYLLVTIIACIYKYQS